MSLDDQELRPRLATSDFFLGVAVFAVAVLPRIATFGQASDVDTATWIRDAQELLRGYVLYRDIGTNKPPLTLLFVAGCLKLGGGSITFLRCVVALLTSSTAVALFLTGRRLFGRVAGIVAGVLFGLDLLSIWYGKSSHVSALLPVFEVWTVCLVVCLWGRRARWMILPGVFCGLAAATKHPGLIMVPVGIVALALRHELKVWRSPERGRAGRALLGESFWYLAGFTAALAPFAAYIVFSGAGRYAAESLFGTHMRLLHATREFRSGYTDLGSKVRPIYWMTLNNKVLWALAGFASLGAVIRKRREAILPVVWLLGVGAFYFIMYYASFPHYLLEWVPPLALLAGMTAQLLWDSAASVGTLPRSVGLLIGFAAWALVLAAVVVAMMGGFIYPATNSIAYGVGGVVFLALAFVSARMEGGGRPRRTTGPLLLVAGCCLLFSYYWQRNFFHEPKLTESNARRVADYVRGLPRAQDEDVLILAPGISYLLPEVELLPIVEHGRNRVSPMGLNWLMSRRGHDAEVVSGTLALYRTRKIRYVVIYEDYYAGVQTKAWNSDFREFFGDFEVMTRFDLSDDYYGRILVLARPAGQPAETIEPYSNTR